MSQDIFGRNIRYAGSLLPETTMITNAGGLGGGLVTGLQMEYTQQLSRMWSLSSTKVYIIAGDTQGQCTVDELWGVAGGNSVNASVCNPTSISISGRNGLCGPGVPGGSASRFTMHDCVINQYRVVGSNSSMQLTKGIGVTFIRLS